MISLGVRPEEYHCAGKKQGTNTDFPGKRLKFAGYSQTTWDKGIHPLFC